MPVKSKRVTLNVITSGSQVICVGLVYFLLYRYLLRQIGVEMLGVWSIVLSTSSLANLANFGVADSVLRFVALFIKEENPDKLKKLIFTSSIFLGGLFLLIALIMFPFADLLLRMVLPIKFLDAGLSILPYSLLCLILNALNSIYSSVLDGMQRNYQRNLIFVLSSVMLLLSAYFFVPKYHLLGTAIAQVCQSVFALVGCSVSVIFRVKYNPLRWNWDKGVFKQIFSYGLKFQFISLASMLNEPVTKILLGKFGGIAFAGYYEMANRVLSQAKGVIASSTQSLVPVMVNLSKDIKEVQTFYKQVFSNVLFFSISGMSILVLGGHILSIYWIGSYQPVFYYTLLILALCLIINMVSAPGYFFYMAHGDLNILIKDHLLLGLTNTATSFCLGYLLGGYGVVYGWFTAVLAGSSYILLTFNKMYTLKFKYILQPHEVWFVLAMVVIAIVNNVFIINYKLNDLLCLGVALLVIIFYFFRYKASAYKLTL